MLLGYSFEPMPNNRALATAGLFMAIGLQKKGCLLSKTKFGGEKIILTCPAVRAAVIQWFGVKSFCPKVGSRDSSSSRLSRFARSVFVVL